MNTQQVKTIGAQLTTQTVRRRVDIPLGFALLRDRRLALRKKMLAVGLGFIGMLLVQVFEIPLELLSVIFANPLGLEDNLEALLWPFLFACSLLPHLAPPGLVDTIRAERER